MIMFTTRTLTCFVLCTFTVFGCSKPVEEKPVVIRTQAIPVTSTPLAAEVSIDGTRIGVTPLTVTVSRNQNHIVTVSKAGHVTKSIFLTQQRDDAGTGRRVARRVRCRAACDA